jgi:hypothetical protein
MTAVLAQPVLFLIVNQGCYPFSRDRVLISSTLPVIVDARRQKNSPKWGHSSTAAGMAHERLTSLVPIAVIVVWG